MVVTCREYNARMNLLNKPYPIMYFTNQSGPDRGGWRIYGYVAYNKHRAEWRKTKKEAIACNVYDD